MKSMGQKICISCTCMTFLQFELSLGQNTQLMERLRDLKGDTGRKIFGNAQRLNDIFAWECFFKNIQIVDLVRVGNVWVHKSFWQPCWSCIRYLVNGDIHSCWKLQLLTMGREEFVLCRRATTHGNKKLLNWLQGNSNSSNDWQWMKRYDQILHCMIWFDKHCSGRMTSKTDLSKRRLNINNLWHVSIP